MPLTPNARSKSSKPSIGFRSQVDAEKSILEDSFVHSHCVQNCGWAKDIRTSGKHKYLTRTSLGMRIKKILQYTTPSIGLNVDICNIMKS